ncbi:MAG: hypothetical protein IPO38_11235 [Rhodocyclaceae bacterium]|nr:hypothetical protein [Rhodocyclaceae bacterium]
MKKLRRYLLISLGIPLLGMAYCTSNFLTAESRVRTACERITPGMSRADLAQYARTHGLAPTPTIETGTSWMVETKTYGRYGCKVLLEAGLVKQADYHFAD